MSWPFRAFRLGLRLLLVLLLTVTLWACQQEGKTQSTTKQPGPRAQGKVLPFETIEQGRQAAHEAPDTRLLVVSRPRDLSFLPPISSEGMEALNRLDYKQYLVIAVYQGWASAGPRRIEIQRISYAGPQPTIYIEATVLTPTLVAQELVYSPYHVVRVARIGELVGKPVIFVLSVNGQEILRQEYWISD